MRIVCAPEDRNFAGSIPDGLRIALYGRATGPDTGAVGAAALRIIQQRKLQPAARAWDLLSIALSVIAADAAVRRDESPDGWTREIDLHVAVSEPEFWTAQGDLLTQLLRFLTTDIWSLTLLDSGIRPTPRIPSVHPDQNAVVLLSGGLDSLIGTIDLANIGGMRPYAVSQVAQGDKRNQSLFASQIGGGLRHLQLNHNAVCPGQNERSQRSRSIVFLAYGVLMATALARYREGEDVTLYVCENGFISINPPLTDDRLGSLSTRTTHPVFLGLFQSLLVRAGLRVKLETPYQFHTKGEMLSGCADQDLLRQYAHSSTSCGRYARNGYKHCGRCLPCLIRRAAFRAWGVPDRTQYVYADLSRDDERHARHDDVRSAAMAVASARTDGLSAWAGPSLSTAFLDDPASYRGVVHRGLNELGSFLEAEGVL